MGLSFGDVAPFAGAALGGVLGGPAGAAAGASMGAAYSSAQGAKEANEQNMQLSQDQMAFQERMSSTAKQREMADMRKAGLNPILAAGGAGASSPSGSAATVQNTKANIGNGISSAMEAVRVKKDLQLADAQTSHYKEQQHLMHDQASKITDERQAMEINNKILKDAAPARAAENSARIAAANLTKKSSDLDSKFLHLDGITSRLRNGLGLVNSAVDVVKPFSSNSSGKNYTPSKGYTDEHYDSHGEHLRSTSRTYK